MSKEIRPVSDNLSISELQALACDLGILGWKAPHMDQGGAKYRSFLEEKVWWAVKRHRPLPSIASGVTPESIRSSSFTVESGDVKKSNFSRRGRWGGVPTATCTDGISLRQEQGLSEGEALSLDRELPSLSDPTFSVGLGADGKAGVWLPLDEAMEHDSPELYSRGDASVHPQMDTFCDLVEHKDALSRAAWGIKVIDPNFEKYPRYAERDTQGDFLKFSQREAWNRANRKWSWDRTALILEAKRRLHPSVLHHFHSREVHDELRKQLVREFISFEREKKEKAGFDFGQAKRITEECVRQRAPLYERMEVGAGMIADLEAEVREETGESLWRAWYALRRVELSRHWSANGDGLVDDPIKWNEDLREQMLSLMWDVELAERALLSRESTGTGYWSYLDESVCKRRGWRNTAASYSKETGIPLSASGRGLPVKVRGPSSMSREEEESLMASLPF